MKRIIKIKRYLQSAILGALFKYLFLFPKIRGLFVLVFLGLLLSLPVLCELGIIAFSAAVLFQLVTLPVEFNASKRAKDCIASYGASEADKKGVNKVLDAAAMTYVAALATSLLSLLRLIMISRSNRRD